MTKTYTEKLQDPKWQRKRLEILSRDNFTCKMCSDDQTQLHIHHEYYTNGSDPWEYPNEALTTLCKHCHVVLEDMKEINATAVIAAKKVHENGNVTVSVLCTDEFVFVRVYLIKPSQSPSFIANITADTCDQISDLFQLSKKLIQK